MYIVLLWAQHVLEQFKLPEHILLEILLVIARMKHHDEREFETFKHKAYLKNQQLMIGFQ